MFEWRELFIPTILERGKGISPTDLANVKVSDEGLTATIKGTETYDLQIHTGCEWISCSCPFAQNNGLACKHMAALLLHCENNMTAELEEFFRGSETSPLGEQAKRYKEKRLQKEREREAKKEERAEKERIAFEKYQEWLRTEPQRQAERAEKARLAEERRIERARQEEEKRKRREERERKRQERLQAQLAKLKALEEERRQQEEQLRIQREKWEAQRQREQAELEAKRKKQQEEWERNAPIREANEKREAERLAREAEEKRQRQIDREVARKRRFLPKHIKKQLAEHDELIRLMEEAEREPQLRKPSKYEEGLRRMEETGWYYEDTDRLDGVFYVDKYGNEVFVPDGFHPGTQ